MSSNPDQISCSRSRSELFCGSFSFFFFFAAISLRTFFILTKEPNLASTLRKSRSFREISKSTNYHLIIVLKLLQRNVGVLQDDNKFYVLTSHRDQTIVSHFRCCVSLSPMHERSKCLHLSPNSAYSIRHFLKLSLLFIPSCNPKKDMLRFHTYFAQIHILLTYLTQSGSPQHLLPSDVETQLRTGKQNEQTARQSSIYLLSVLFVSRGEFDIVFVFIKNLKHAN